MGVDEVSAGVIREWLIRYAAKESRLPPESIDPHAPLTSLGIDSLALLMLTGDLAEWMHQDLPASVLNHHSTIDSLARYLSQEEPDTITDNVPELSRKEALPVSFSQERLLKFAEMGDGGDANLVVERFSMRGDVDVAALQGALEDVAQRHEILRTTFQRHDGGFTQRVHEGGRLVAFEMLDYSGDEDGAWARAFQEASRPLLLQSGPLLRVLLYKLGEHHHGIVFIFHHLLVDAGALNVFHAELKHFYEQRRTGELPPLPGLKLQVADFAAWEREWLSKESAPYQTRLAWWRNYWKGELPPPLELPMRHRETPDDTPPSNSCHCTHAISADLAEGVRALAREEKVTPFMVFFAAFTALLYAKTFQEEFVIGSYVSDRKRVAARNLIGMFASMVAIRVRIVGSPSVREWVAQLRVQQEEVTRYQELPFEDLHDRLRAEGLPVPEVNVIFQSYVDPVSTFLLPGVEVTRWREVSESTMPWGFQFRIRESFGGLIATAGFDGKLYRAGEVPAFMEEFEKLLRASLANPERPVRDLAGEVGVW
jgi:acyl carrier protein